MKFKNDNFKKIGDLQYYGFSFLSLYHYDNEFYISLKVYIRNEYESYLFLKITKEHIIDYLNLKLSLKKLMQIYQNEICYVKYEYDNGNIRWKEKKSIPKQVIPDDDEFFIPEFCFNLIRINNVLKKL